MNNNVSYIYERKEFAAVGLLFGIGSAAVAIWGNRKERFKNKEINGMLPIDATVLEETITLTTTHGNPHKESVRDVTLQWTVGFTEYQMKIRDDAFDHHVGHDSKLLYDTQNPAHAIPFVEKDREDGLDFISALLAMASVVSVLGGIKPKSK